ncbi:hypothetical protein F511_02438 [Dorcoceras hygrometricum]|nr:hypothetical protein F511_02438 [Dorcoceras hygrometricum]
MCCVDYTDSYYGYDSNKMLAAEPKSYVVFIGRKAGVYEKWCEASEQVRGFSGACYKGFDTKKEAEEAYSCYLEAMNGPRAHKKCESEKTNTPSTSKPQHAKNSAKLAKVLRDLAVEIHNHAAKMEKVVEEIGQILEDMAFTVGKTMPISLLEEEHVTAFHDAGRQQLENSLDIIIPALGHAKAATLKQHIWKIDLTILIDSYLMFSLMAVCTKIGSEDTVTSKYVVPMIDLSSDEDEGLYGEGRSCGRKKKLRNMGVNSPVASEKKKRMKFCNVTTSLMNKTEFERLPEKDNSKGAQKVRGPTIPIIIEISDDSVG